MPEAWLADVRGRGLTGQPPTSMGEGEDPSWEPWQPGGESWLDRGVAATRHAVFPLCGLDPDDPRD